jgi:hypothetical protein
MGMKNQICILSFLAAISLISCQKKSFSPSTLSGGNNLSQSNPGDPNCVSTDPELDYPDSVGSGTVFTMSYNRDNVLWNLTLADGTQISLDGSPVTTSLTPIGRVSATVSGIDNCGRNSFQEFTFEVTGETFPTTTTTTLPPAPPTTLPPVTTTTLPPAPPTTLPPTTTTTLPPAPPTTLPPTTTTTLPPAPPTTLPPTTTTTLPPAPPTTLPPTNPPTQTQDFTVDSSGSADILFVVNDSSSMWYTLRESIPVRFSHFIPQLGKVDYHISVTSAQTRGVADYQGGRIAKVLYEPVPFTGLNLVPYQYAVTSDMRPHAERNFLATVMRPEAICIAGMMPCPQTGDAYQEAIHSSIMALSNPDSVAKLVRPGAALNLVIISDDDEGAGNLTDSHGNLKSSAPSYNRPQTLIDLIHSKWPGKAFRAHAVIQRPEDPLCWNADIYNARQAYLYNDLVKKTGGSTAEICNVYDEKEIKKIARSIVTASPTFQLKCQPTTVQATYSPTPSSPTRVVVSGNSVSFDPPLPSGTKVHLQYQCP